MSLADPPAGLTALVPRVLHDDKFRVRPGLRDRMLVVFVSTGDLGRLAAAEPHINEYVRSIKLVDAYEEV